MEIKIGYEIGTGKEVKMRMAHLVTTGITQESGKTTTLQALIERGKCKAIIFRTKIGERGITNGTIIPPYYKDDFDWEYASEILEASRKEKLKFERAWIIKYAKTANNLIEFKSNIDKALADDVSGEKRLRELDKSVLITLQAYLEKILPELQYAPLSNTLDLQDGINIMDLERFKEETQSLIIRSVLNEVLRQYKNTVIVIPECWKYLPERLGNPVKRPAEAFIRQGATNNNYLWLDSQDITGVSKSILKQVSNWILGYQREINEIKRTLDQIPLPRRQRPNPEDIASLGLGHFFIATSQFTKKIYVQPVWVDDKTAKEISLGKKNVRDLEQPRSLSPYSIQTPKALQETPLEDGQCRITHDSVDMEPIKKELTEMRNDFFNKIQEQQQAIDGIYSELFKLKGQPTTPTVTHEINMDEIVGKVLQKIPVGNGNAPIDREAIVNDIIARIPKTAGAVTYEVAPLEKIQKGFLEEAKNKILTDIGSLDNDQKKMLKWVEQNAKNTKKHEVFLNTFGKSTTSGSAYTAMARKVLEMKQLEVIRVDTQQRIFPHLKQRIINLIEQYGATDQEIEQCYNHILVEML